MNNATAKMRNSKATPGSTRLGRTVVALLMAAGIGLGQPGEEPVVLVITLEDDVLYRGNVSDVSRLAKDPTPTTSANQAFLESVAIADIRAVNGVAVQGFRSYHVRALPFRVNPLPGQAIADADGSGTYLGAITDRGATPSPDHIVVGGSGAFLGVTGVHRAMERVSGPMQRAASMSEDPANRRLNGGGQSRTTFYLYPRYRPQIEMTPSGPAVFHADFSLVTAQRPAQRGEQLIVRATGLGPVKPGLEPPGAKPFSRDPVQEVSSPVTVLLNGRELPAVNKIGWPGETSAYRVDFEVPSDAAPGEAKIQLVAAWIPGFSVTIPVR
jgi:hypothetical protein